MSSIKEKEIHGGKTHLENLCAPQNLSINSLYTFLPVSLQQTFTQEPYRFRNNRLEAQIPIFSSQKMLFGVLGAPCPSCQQSKKQDSKLFIGVL